MNSGIGGPRSVDCPHRLAVGTLADPGANRGEGINGGRKFDNCGDENLTVGSTVCCGLRAPLTAGDSLHHASSQMSRRDEMIGREMRMLLRHYLEMVTPTASPSATNSSCRRVAVSRCLPTVHRTDSARSVWTRSATASQTGRGRAVASDRRTGAACSRYLRTVPDP